MNPSLRRDEWGLRARSAVLASNGREPCKAEHGNLDDLVFNVFLFPSRFLCQDLHTVWLLNRPASLTAYMHYVVDD